MLTIIFVVVTILLVLSCLGAGWGPEAQRPLVLSSFYLLVVIDICILGYVVLGGHRAL